MNLLKHKWMAGLLAGVLLISFGLGAVVYHYGSQYEKTTSVYMKSLSWVMPPSTAYRTIAIDEDDSNLYWCLGKEQIDYVDANGQVVKSKPLADTEEDILYENNGLPYRVDGYDQDWESYKGRSIKSVWAVDEEIFAVSFAGRTPEEESSDYMLFNQNKKPVLGDRMFEVILRECDGMRYFISSDQTFDGKPAKKECGFLNEKGEVAFTFDHEPLCVNDFSEGMTIVYDDRLYGYDKEGRQIFAVDYTGTEIKAEQRENFEEYTLYSMYYTQFADGLAPVTLDGELMGYIDKEGKIVIEPIFKAAEPVLNKTAAVCLTQSSGAGNLINERWGILDLREVQ